MSVLTRWLVPLGLLLSAFAPLAAALAVVAAQSWGATWAAVLGSVIVVVAFAFLFAVLRSVLRMQVHVLEPASVRAKDRDVLGFYASWVVPVGVGMLARDATQAALGVALAMLLAVIYVRARLFYLNPLLALLGYRLYEVTATNGTQVMVLSRRAHVPQRDPLRVAYLGDTCALDRTRDPVHPREPTTGSGP